MHNRTISHSFLAALTYAAALIAVSSASAIAATREVQLVPLPGQESAIERGDRMVISRRTSTVIARVEPIDSKKAWIALAIINNQASRAITVEDRQITASASGSNLKIYLAEDIIHAEKRSQIWKNIAVGLVAGINAYAAGQQGHYTETGTVTGTVHSSGRSADFDARYRAQGFDAAANQRARDAAYATNSEMIHSLEAENAARLQVLGNELLYSQTIAPGEAHTGRLQFALPKKVRNVAQEITLDILIEGDRHRYIIFVDGPPSSEQTRQIANLSSELPITASASTDTNTRSTVEPTQNHQTAESPIPGTKVEPTILSVSSGSEKTYDGTVEQFYFFDVRWEIIATSGGALKGKLNLIDTSGVTRISMPWEISESDAAQGVFVERGAGFPARAFKREANWLAGVDPANIRASFSQETQSQIATRPNSESPHLEVAVAKVPEIEKPRPIRVQSPKGGLLAYISDDTPYVIANMLPTSRSVFDKWLADFWVQLAIDDADDPDDVKGREEIEGALRDFIPGYDKMSVSDIMKKFGLDLGGLFSLHGFGLMPVLHLQFSDPELFYDEIANIEERLGEDFSKRIIGEYEFIEIREDTTMLLAGRVGDFLVITVAPANATPARLEAQIGLTPPAISLAATDKLGRLKRDHSYDGRFLGYIDFQSIASRLGGRSPDDKEAIIAMTGEVPKIDTTCLTEFASLAEKFPRIVFGTREFDSDSRVIGVVVETNPGLAAEMQKLAIATPMTVSDDPLMFDFSVSLDLNEVILFAKNAAGKVVAEPYRCEDLTDFNETAASIAREIDGLASAISIAPNRVRVGIRNPSSELAGTDGPLSISAFMVMSSQSPSALFGMAKLSFPALGEVDVPINGDSVAIPDGALPIPGLVNLSASMTDSTFTIASSDIRAPTFAPPRGATSSPPGTVVRGSYNGNYVRWTLGLSQPNTKMTDADARKYERRLEKVNQAAVQLGRLDWRVAFTRSGIEFEHTRSLP